MPSTSCSPLGDALVFTWLFPILALLVKLSSKGPVFFKQVRLGRDNKEFVCWKFRSMRMNKEADFKQATRTTPGHCRGAFPAEKTWTRCRSSSTCCSAQMSVVGPRPHPLRLNDQYCDIIDKYMVRPS